MTRRYALWNNQGGFTDWLLDREDTVNASAKDNRLFVEALLYRYRAKIPGGD